MSDTDLCEHKCARGTALAISKNNSYENVNTSVVGEIIKFHLIGLKTLTLARISALSSFRLRFHEHLVGYGYEGSEPTFFFFTLIRTTVFC